MKFRRVGGREVDGGLRGSWEALQSSNPNLVSPYFAFEFTEAVAAERNDVEIGIVEDGNQVVGILPFQRGSWGIGLPVGGTISDYQGLIAAADFSCDPRRLLAGWSLRAWDFDHLLAAQPFWSPHHRYLDYSPVMDVSRGYQEYCATCHAARVEQIKLRRLEREVGPLNLVVHDSGDVAFNWISRWKARQYHDTGVVNIFEQPWICGVLKRLQQVSTPQCGGVLSLLYAGDSLVAGQLGMRSRTEWHWWFPTYDTRFAKYFPGIVLLLKMAEVAESIGLRRINLGKGPSLYKSRMMNSSVQLAVGSVDASRWLGRTRNFYRGSRRLAGRALRAMRMRTPPSTPA